MPQADWKKAATYGLETEKAAFTSLPDRQTYDATMQQKVQDMVQRRHQNAPNLQNQLNADAAARQQQQQQQAHLQAQQQRQQQLFMNQMRSMGQPLQHGGFQQPQNPMQASQLPQQQAQGLAMGMNPGMLQTRPDQRQFQMAMAQQQRPNMGPQDVNVGKDQLGQMTQSMPQVKIAELANRLYQQAPPASKEQARQTMQRMSPAQFQEFSAQGKDPAMLYYQNQAIQQFRAAQARAMQQQQQQQQQQQRSMAGGVLQPQGQPTPGAMAALDPQQNGVDAQMFPASVETIRNEQLTGLMAQRAGQIVVPGRNTPNPINGIPGQTAQANQQRPGQAQLPPQSHPQFMAQAAAQARAQAVNRMQGQPGGLAGPTPNSQSPMVSLTAAMPQPPIPMGQPNGQPMNQNPQQAGGTLNPQFSHQLNTRPSPMQNLMNNPQFAQMLQAMTPEVRANLSNVPEGRLQDLFTKWVNQQRSVQGGFQPQKPPPMTPGLQVQPVGLVNNANQFPVAGNPQQPNSMMTTPNQPATIAHQLTDRARAMSSVMSNPATRAMVDSWDIPLQVLNNLRSVPIPNDIRKWGQLKTWWEQTNLIPPQLQQQLLNVQLQHFKSYAEKRSAQNAPAAAAAAAAAAAKQQRPMTGAPQLLGAPNVPNATAGFQLGGPLPPLPPHIVVPAPTSQELQSFRQSGRYPNLSDQELVPLVVKWKTELLTKRYWQQQMQNQQNQANNTGLAEQKHPPQNSAAPTSQPGPAPPQQTVAPVQAPSMARQPSVQKPAGIAEQETPAPPSATMKNRPPPQNRPTPASLSPSTAQNRLKRPNPDDQGEASAPSTAQRPASQITGTQLTPEQKERYSMLLHNLTNSLSDEIKDRVKTLASATMEEWRRSVPDPPVQVSEAELPRLRAEITMLTNKFAGFGKHLTLYYSRTKDDPKVKLFFKLRCKLGANTTQNKDFKDQLNITRSELQQAQALIGHISGHVTEYILSIMNAPPGGATTNAPAAQQPTQTSAPNTEKQAQASKQPQSQVRGGPRAGQPPAAPTTSQPPFGFGGQKSPTGEPTYFNKPTVTMQTLNPPPANKKRRTGAPQTSSPSVQQGNGASPQTKATSPDVRRQPAPVTAPTPTQATATPEVGKAQVKQFTCPEPDCDTHLAGFSTEEARNAHVQEEHTKPNEDPFKFLRDNITSTLALDGNGVPKVAGQEVGQASAPAMKTSLSRQGQTPSSKPDSTATPMSREASTRQQGNAAGTNKSEGTPRLADSKLVVAKQETEGTLQLGGTDAPWAGSTVDPQNLFAPYVASEPFGTGFLADFTAYRSSTPNDTPESSKDSGASEPNSDISEGANIDIDLSFQPMDNGDLLFDMSSFSMEGLEGMEGMEGMDSLDRGFTVPGSLEFSELDDMQTDFSKPFQFDSSMYMMDA
jgi:hypothetical protein